MGNQQCSAVIRELHNDPEAVLDVKCCGRVVSGVGFSPEVQALYDRRAQEACQAMPVGGPPDAGLFGPSYFQEHFYGTEGIVKRFRVADNPPEAVHDFSDIRTKYDAQLALGLSQLLGWSLNHFKLWYYQQACDRGAPMGTRVLVGDINRCQVLQSVGMNGLYAVDNILPGAPLFIPRGVLYTRREKGLPPSYAAEDISDDDAQQQQLFRTHKLRMWERMRLAADDYGHVVLAVDHLYDSIFEVPLGIPQEPSEYLLKDTSGNQPEHLIFMADTRMFIDAGGCSGTLLDVSGGLGNAPAEHLQGPGASSDVPPDGSDGNCVVVPICVAGLTLPVVVTCGFVRKGQQFTIGKKRSVRTKSVRGTLDMLQEIIAQCPPHVQTRLGGSSSEPSGGSAHGEGCAQGGTSGMPAGGAGVMAGGI